MEVRTNAINNGIESIIEAFPIADDLENSLTWIRSQGITYININKYHGWKDGMALDFLRNHTWIKGIWIVDEKLDLTPINHLVNLESFGFSGDIYSGFVDFRNLLGLKILVYKWAHKNLLNFESLKALKVLHIYKWPFEDLHRLCFATNLTTLEMHFSKKLVSLSGIECFEGLFRLLITSAPELENIDNLRMLSSSLKRLSLNLVRNVKDFSVLDSLSNLESFNITKSAPIHSIQWMKKLENLKYAYVDTEVLDGNVEFLRENGFKYKQTKK